MEQYQRFLELQLAKARTRLVLYRTRLKRAEVARRSFPDNPALKDRVTTCEELVETAEREIDELSGQLDEMKTANPE